MSLKLEIIWRYVNGQNKIVKLTSFLACLGVVLGVACLVVSMSVVSGVQSFIRDSIVDLSGHIIITRPGGMIEDYDELKKNVQKSTNHFKAMTPFAYAQGVVVGDGHVSGVVLHGLERKSYKEVLNLEHRLLSGQVSLETSGGVPQAIVGKELAKKLKLKVGDAFQVVIPRPSRTKIRDFNTKNQRFVLAGILDFGKYDYNEKVIVASASAVQKVSRTRGKYRGAYVLLDDYSLAGTTVDQLIRDMGYDYRFKDWKEVNYNFFSAVELEKIIIFIVILFIVIVASFNVSSTIFVNVMKRFSDIAILQTLGASRKFLVKLFIYQGLLLGTVGSFLGILFGYILSLIIKYTNFIEIPGDVYKFDHLPVELRLNDVIIIFIVTILISFLSAIVPAIKGSRLKPVEGLRYE